MYFIVWRVLPFVSPSVLTLSISGTINILPSASVRFPIGEHSKFLVRPYPLICPFPISTGIPFRARYSSVQIANHCFNQIEICLKRDACHRNNHTSLSLLLRKSGGLTPRFSRLHFHISDHLRSEKARERAKMRESDNISRATPVLYSNHR